MFLNDGFIGLGSNLEDPMFQLGEAVRQLRKVVILKGLSRVYRSEPFDAPPQPWFCNAVAHVAFDGSPDALLRLCQSIELAQGREREKACGPRTIDLDVLLAGETVVASGELTIPHSQLHRRRFVLVPMVELAPELVHPILGFSMRELLERCPDKRAIILERHLEMQT